jgi:hypothetical protein
MPTWLPTEAVVADKLVITGAGADVELMETLSNVAVSKYPSPHTSKPMYTVCDIGIVALEPICSQLTPSGEMKPVKLSPLRTNLTQ